MIKKLLCLGIFLILVFNFGSAAGGEKVVGEYNYEGVTDIQVDGKFFSVEVSTHAGGGVRLRTEMSSRLVEKVAVVSENRQGRLRIRVEHPVIFSVNLGPRDPKCRIILTVPASVGLTATTTAGSIGVKGLMTKRVEINATAGSVRLNSIEADLKVGTTAGSIYLEDCRGDKNISTTAGSITIENAAGAIEARTTAGSQHYQGIRGDITAVCTAGSIDIEDHEGRLDLQTATGSISGRQIRLTGDSSFRAVTGSIDMTFANDLREFSFSLSAQTGSIRVGDVRGRGRLELGDGGILVRGETTTGGQTYTGR